MLVGLNWNTFFKTKKKPLKANNLKNFYHLNLKLVNTCENSDILLNEIDKFPNEYKYT